MNYAAWLIIAGGGGTAAILGSLMTLGSFILWLSSRHQPRVKSDTSDASGRYGLFKLFGMSLFIAGLGWALLLLVLLRMPLLEM